MPDSAERDEFSGGGAHAVANLPARIDAPARAALSRPGPSADFISQLIAERNHLPPQRQRRRATMSDALDAYDSTAAQAVGRLPPGYRTTLLV